MRDLIIIIALISLAIGLRLSKGRLCKKLGAFVFVISMGYVGYSITHCWIGVVGFAILWALAPFLFIYLKNSKKQYPITPRTLKNHSQIDEAFFPHASSYRVQLEDLGFENIDEQSWQWLDAQQHHRFLWHPEYNTIASICLCEQEKIAFCFIIFYSELADGTTIKTTNYPFSSPLVHPPHSHWTHVPCEEKHIPAILKTHRATIQKNNTTPCSVILPDPDSIAEKWCNELKGQAHYNLSKKLIKSDEEQFTYTIRGYVYLWAQAMKDFVRLC